MEGDEGNDGEQTGEGSDDVDGSTEGQSKFFAAYADNEIGIPDDSPRDSRKARPSKAEADDDDTGTDDDADLDEADRKDDDDDDDDDLDEEDDATDEDEGGEDEDDKAAARKEDDDEGEEPDFDEKAFLEDSERHKLPTDFEALVKKLPAEARKEARGLFNGVLKEVKAGYTRLSQEHTEFRAREKGYLAERAFLEKHPEEFILEIFMKHPELVEKIDTRLSGLDDPKTKAVEERFIELKKSDVSKETAKVADSQEQRIARGKKVARFAQRLCDHYGIDYELVEDRLILEVKASEKGDISEDHVRQIIKDRAKKIKGSAIAKKAGARKDWVKDKIAASKRGKASPTDRARRMQGRVPAPSASGGKKLTFEQELTRTVRKIAPGMARE